MSASPEGAVRLDVELVSRGLARSRNHAASLIRDGRVTVDGRGVVKASAPVAAGQRIEVDAADAYVSRAAHKLAGALDAFGIDPSGLVCLDAGASTGGFPQVLLERGAARVVAVDVGHGQLSAALEPEIRAGRLVSLEGVNVRELTAAALEPHLGGAPSTRGNAPRSGTRVGDALRSGSGVGNTLLSGDRVGDALRSGSRVGGDLRSGGRASGSSTERVPERAERVEGPPAIALVVADLSFISLALVLPALTASAPGAELVVLIKPQFEVGRTGVREGIVRDAALRAEAIEGVLWAAHDAGLRVVGLIASPIVGTHGNSEYLAHLSPGRGGSPSEWSTRIAELAGG